jgi:predicted MFS family arabinose efflux permease
MQIGLSLSPSYVGTILLPAGIVLAVTIPLVGRLADSTPTHTLVCAGLSMLAASFALMTVVGVGSALWLLVGVTVLGRIGLGFVLPSLNLGAMRGLDKGLIAQASSSINFLRMLGGSVGVSLCGIFLQWRLAAYALPGASTEMLRQGQQWAFAQTFALLALLCALAIFPASQLSAKGRLES